MHHMGKAPYCDSYNAFAAAQYNNQLIYPGYNRLDEI